MPVVPSCLSEPPAIAPWRGCLELTYAQRENGTRVIHQRATAPLKVQRSFYPEGKQVCHSVMLHTAGGLVGGDQLAYTIEVQPEAQALITTPAASKLYRSNGFEAQQTIQVTIAPGARLEWLPQEAIVFNGARYRQTMQIHLAPAATWMGWEITRFGRTARGETFQSGDWRSRTEVWQAGQPLWIDRQWMPGNETVLSSANGLAGYPVVGSLALVGQAVTREVVEQARSQWGGQGEVGVTRLMSGLLCRYRGHSTAEARQWFLAVWHLLRTTYHQQAAHISRVWQAEAHS